MNRKGQFSIIAALLVAAILITTVIVTYSTIRSSLVQNQPPILNAIDEINLAIKQILGFTVGYYGSVLQITGNVSYANQSATNYLQSGLQNIANMHPEWGTSINLNSSALQAYWFSSISYSSGTLTVNYDLPGLGIIGVSYKTSCLLGVQTINTTTGQACLSITQDQNQPLVTLGMQNFNFYNYNNTSSTWQLVNPLAEPTAYANGTYYVNVPSGINPYSYVVQVQDQRGIIVVAASFNSYTAALTWNSTSVQAGSPSAQYYVNSYNSSVDSFPDIGTHSNFTAQQKADGVYDNLTESGSNVINAYYPLGYNLLGSTQHVSGSLSDLQTDNNAYMTFLSYQNATSAQTLYAHQEMAAIAGVSYYLLNSSSADASGTTLSNSTGSTGRKLMGSFVYSLANVSFIPASTWTVNYTAWTDNTPSIAFDNSSSGNNGAGSSSISWSHTTSSSPNRIMIVGVSIRSSSVYVSTITYGTQKLTNVRNDSANGIRSELWNLTAPASGTAMVSVTLSGSARAVGGSCTYAGVDQTSPIDAQSGTTGNSYSPSRSITVNTANSILLGNLAIYASSSTVSSETGQTMRWDNATSGTSANRGHGSQKGPVTAGSQSMSWSLSSSSYWAVSLVALKPASPPSVHADIDVQIRHSDGTNTTILTSTAPSPNLTTSQTTLSGTCSWANYNVTNPTDYLEIDYYVNVATATLGTNAYLKIDDKTLAAINQTSVTNILLPSQYVSQVEFYGNSDISSWANLTWTVDSSFTINGVNATFQLFNSQAGTYPTSSDGFITTTIGTANLTQTQTITSNPTYFRNATGYWKLKVTGNASTQFDWKVDLGRFQTLSVNYALALEEQWTNVNYTSAQLCIKTGSLAAEALAVDAWNGSAWINVLGSLNASSWNNITVSAYLQPSTFTIRFKSTNGTYPDTVQDSWQIDAALLTVWPTIDLYSLSRQGTIVVELLQNGTMRWLGQSLVFTNSDSTLPFPPVPVKSIHVNETINGVNGAVPFQIEDWSSAYHVPLGLTSNMSIFSSRTMLVFLATPNASKVTIWWNGSDTATQTPYAYTNRYFSDSPSSGTLSNGVTKLQFQGNFVVTSTVGGSSSTANFMQINGYNSTYGSLPSYVITNGPVRDIVHQEAEWSNGVTNPNCSDIYSDIVLTLPANATYYTYQLSLMFVQSQQNRTINDLCPVWLTSLTGQVQTENGTANGLPNVSNASDLFYNYSASAWAHHWSQSIAGANGTGIMFTDNANQNLYLFDSIKGVQTGALVANSSTQTIQLLPVTRTTVSFNQTLDPRMQDIVWYGAIATFNATTSPIYSNTDQTGLWILVEYPPTVAVTGQNNQLS